MDFTRRKLLKTTAALLVEQWAAAKAIAEPSRPVTDRKILLVTCGGIRSEDTFAESGIANIPHLFHDLLP